MKSVFSKPSVSDRLHSESMELEEKLIRDDFKLSKRADAILGDTIKQEGKFGVGNGPYSQKHKKLRQIWHIALLKLHGKSKIQELIRTNSKLLCQTIRAEMENNKSIEPLPALLNSSMNVITAFVLGSQIKFDDHEFTKINGMIKVFHF